MFRDKRGRFARNMNLYKVFFILVVLGSIVAGTWHYIKTLANDFDRLLVVESVQAEIINSTPAINEVLRMITDAGIDITKAVALNKCEGNFKADVVVPVKNKLGQVTSYDRGQWQINSYYHKEVSDTCAYDLICSTREFIRIQQQKGWSEWNAYGNDCYKRELDKIKQLFNVK